VTLAAAGVSLWMKTRGRRHRGVAYLAAALLILTALLKGTTPGGPRARSAFKAAQRAG
jgi:hypothetical protein